VEAMVGLCIVAVVTGMFSEMLVDSIDGMTKQLQLSEWPRWLGANRWIDTGNPLIH
jgi:hypothetical protein